MKTLPAQAFRKLARLYEDMEASYQSYARALELTCEHCENNCCTSYFQHHTHIEWAYLMQGLNALPAQQRETLMRRAEHYVLESARLLAQGEKPQLMCPLNTDGRCGLYTHRLMICRLHGVPNCLHYPNGQILEFPGCFRSQALCVGLDRPPILDRTPLYTRLMELEIQFVGAKRIRTLPRVDLTLAEMMLKGLPKFI